MGRAADWRGVPGLQVYAFSLPDGHGGEYVRYLIAAYDARYARGIAKLLKGRAKKISVTEGNRLAADGIGEYGSQPSAAELRMLRGEVRNPAKRKGAKRQPAKRTTRARARGNPPLTIFANPARRKRGELISSAVKEIWYVHVDDGKLYRHEFARGVSAEMLPDGSARFFRPDGKPVLRDFP
jgi:hypothetical protein